MTENKIKSENQRQVIREFEILSGICRSCLRKSEDLFDFNSVFEDDFNLTILECWKTVISDVDEISKFSKICLACLDELKNAYDFKIKCYKSGCELKRFMERDLDEREDIEESNIVQEVLVKEEFNNFPCLSSMEQQEQEDPYDILITESYTCDYCNQTFKQKLLLQNHILIHRKRSYEHQFDVFNCKFCSKQFDSPRSLDVHMKTHTRPWSCDLCQSSFKLKHHLVQHYRSHTKEKPFQCDLCHATFSHSSTLGQHRKAHLAKLNGIEYVCTLCQKKFTRQKILNAHMKTHIEEKRNYACPDCPKKYYEKANLRAHYFVRHLNNLTFKCKFCGADLKLNERFHKTYTNHVQKQHSDLPDDILAEFMDEVKKLKIQELTDKLPKILTERIVGIA